MPPIPENSLSSNAPVVWAIFASESGRMAGPPRPPVDTRASTFISNSSVSGSITGSDVNVVDEEMAATPPSLHDDVGRGRRELGPHRDRRHFLHDLRHDRDELVVLSDVRAHIGPVH